MFSQLTPVGQKEAEFRTLDFLDWLNANNAQRERFSAVGVGTEERFGLESMEGFTLSYNERMIHFTALHAAGMRGTHHEDTERLWPAKRLWRISCRLHHEA